MYPIVFIFSVLFGIFVWIICSIFPKSYESECTMHPENCTELNYFIDMTIKYIVAIYAIYTYYILNIVIGFLFIANIIIAISMALY